MVTAAVTDAAEGPPKAVIILAARCAFVQHNTVKLLAARARGQTNKQQALLYGASDHTAAEAAPP